MVRLVDHQQIGRRQIHAAVVPAAHPQGLDRGHLHQFERARLDAGHDDAGIDAVRAQLVGGLRDDLAPMRQHEHRLLRARGRADDVGADDGLAAPGRRHQDDAPLPAATAP